jgi:hypothetical protein
LEAFCDVFLGWRLGDDYQHNPNCLFGRIKAFFFKHESSGRGAIHGHGMICASDLQPERVQWLMQQPETRQQLAALIDSLMAQFLPELENPAGEPNLQFHAACITSSPTTVKRADLQVHCLNSKCTGCLQHRAALGTAAVYNKDVQPGACHPALDGSVPIFDLKKSLAYKVVTQQKHGHNHSCRCGDPKTTPQDDMDANCRFARPWRINSHTYIDPKTGCVHTRCDDGMLLPYCAAVHLGCSCNHAFYLMGDMSRFVRDHFIWAHKKAQNPLFRGLEPVCPTLVENARIASEYASEFQHLHMSQ